MKLSLVCVVLLVAFTSAQYLQNVPQYSLKANFTRSGWNAGFAGYVDSVGKQYSWLTFNTQGKLLYQNYFYEDKNVAYSIDESGNCIVVKSTRGQFDLFYDWSKALFQARTVVNGVQVTSWKKTQDAKGVLYLTTQGVPFRNVGTTEEGISNYYDYQVGPVDPKYFKLPVDPGSCA
jgi:hypothetical protein